MKGAKKENLSDFSIEKDLLLLHFDKFISKERNVVVISLDDEYDKFL